VGWYFDLPETGERVPSDVMLREKKVIVIGYVPKETHCGAGGDSVLMELNAATGGRLNTIQFDVNSDGVIDEHDLVNIGTEENPIWAAPTGLQYQGRLLPPAILQIGNGTEMKYSSDSQGQIQTILEKAARLGISYWKEYE
jgi:type IV pilus assembly protein PilY1